MKTTIDRAGRVVIPKALRDRAGFKPGMEIELRYNDGIIEIDSPPPEGEIVKEGSFWVWKSAPGTLPITQEEINQAIEDVRAERERDILDSIS